MESVEKNTARLIVTFKCPKSCSYCINHQVDVVSNAIEISDVEALAAFPIVCITGGEPLIKARAVINIARILKDITPDIKIYMYTAAYNFAYAEDLIRVIDGITFTLHRGTTAKDIHNLERWQEIIGPRCDVLSCNLNIDGGILTSLPIIPAFWKRIQIKRWYTGNEAYICENEQLFVLREEEGD